MTADCLDGLTGERGLAAAVIARALADLVPCRGNGPASVAEAESFLTSTGARWATSRAAWCELADVDEPTVRRHALAMIARRDASPVRREAYPVSRLELSR